MLKADYDTIISKRIMILERVYKKFSDTLRGERNGDTMTFEQMEYFVTLAEYKNFSVAAEECYISQSSLSKQIKSLEMELGVKLLDRNTRKLELTYAGKEYLSYSSRILPEYKKMLKTVKKYSANTQEIIRIGAIPVMNHYGLTDIFFNFQKQYDRAHLKIIEQNSSNIVEAFIKEEVDMAFLRSNCLPEGDFRIYPLVDDEMVLITELAHPLARKDKINLKEASGEEFLLLGNSTGMYQTCVSACKEAGFLPREKSLDLRSSTIKNLVANGQGVSLMMNASIKYMNDPRVKVIHLENPPIVNLCLVTRKDVENDLEHTFIEYVCDCFDKLD